MHWELLQSDNASTHMPTFLSSEIDGLMLVKKEEELPGEVGG